MAGSDPLERTLDIKDGGRVHVRSLRPEDEELLREAFARMSERSVYFRFMSPLKRLPEELAHRLARADYKDRVALAAITHRPDGKEHIVGVSRYDRAPGTQTAEVAVAVIDEYQRKGVGAGLLGLLAEVAREHGVEQFQLIVLPENQSMLRLLRRLGWVHRARYLGDVYEITFDV